MEGQLTMKTLKITSLKNTVLILQADGETTETSGVFDKCSFQNGS